MKELNVEQFMEMLNNNQISPFNIYNLDQDYQQYYSIKHYLNYPHDNFDLDQKLQILFLDIEVYTGNANEFPQPQHAKYPISAITIYSTFEKIYRSYIFLQHLNVNKFPDKNNLADLEEYYKNELINDGYIDRTEQVKVTIVANELDLIKQVWSTIREIDPVILSGWSVENFDLPYIYFRLTNLLNKNEKEVKKIFSQFETVKVQKTGESYLIQIPEYPVLDLLYLYKPRDEKGLNYGEKQPNYSLDFIADAELNLRKKQYKAEGMSLDTFYETDPVNFLLYNIIDVVLVNKLNSKLRHIEAHNSLRRLMKTCFSRSLSGSAVLFDTYVNYKLAENNRYVRFGIIEELNVHITEDEINNIYVPKKMKKVIKGDIDHNIFRAITGRYPGAYVKQPIPRIITAKDGITIDLDASSLYPSMIIQSNISFDTFFGKIIDPICYDFINTFNNLLKSEQKLPQLLFIKIYERVEKYVDRIGPQNKTEYTQYCYFIISYLMDKIARYGKSLEELFNPKTPNDYTVLKKYFLPLIDLIEDSHPNSKEYNSFCNNYLLNGEISSSEHIFIIENILQPTIRVNCIKATDIEQYLKQNNVSLTLSGCLFLKHEVKEGLFIEFLKNLKNLRNQYERERDRFDEDSEQYLFYDMRQKAVKITSNTTYGLFGQSTYRFSNKYLAKAITVQGRLTLKIAQMIGELYLKKLMNQ